MAPAIEDFKQISPSEFFYRNREIAGFSSPSRALYQTVRELVENALDATEAYGILPDVLVQISQEDPERPEHFTVTVEDNGVGIPPHVIPDAFGRVLFSSKYKFKQTRGMYGLGAKMAILYGQLTTGKPFEIYSSTLRSKYIYYFKLMIDVKNNEPVVLERGAWAKSFEWHGTIARVIIEGEWNKRVRDQVVVYVKRTAMIAPYANIVLVVPQLGGKPGSYEVMVFKRVTTKMPRAPKESRPHPAGVDLEMLKLMISETKAKTLREFLVKEFQRIGKEKALRILAKAGLDPERSPKDLSGEEIAKLYEAVSSEKYLSPRPEALSPIGEEIIKVGLAESLKPEFVEALTRAPKSYGGHPFVVEGGIAYGGELVSRLDEIAQDSLKSQEGPRVVLFRFANKIPLLHDEKSDVAWHVVDPSRFPWKDTYKLADSDTVAVLVHVASTKIPYKGVGKESVADVEELESEIRLLVQELARRLRAYLVKKKREQEAEEKLLTFLRYIPEVSRSLAAIASDGASRLSETLAKEIENRLKKLALKKLGLSESALEALTK